MKVNLINEVKDAYKSDLKNSFAKPDSLYRRCILNWQTHFDIDQMRLGPVLAKSLKNDVSGRFWGGERYSIKESLILLANHNPDLFWESIKDLLNEEKMLVMRTDRFLHHCDIIFNDYLKANPNSKEDTHRQGHYSASLLLSLQFPMRYALLEYAVFERFCESIEVNDTPIRTDLERFTKIVNATYKVISKDEDFMTAYYQALEHEIYLGPSLDVVSNLMHFNSKKL
ncbi:hypothetical protein [Portibacter marinus]|uniref:hypothetical protein n=1 Tax=Portibacter marinus TaxID=2898660 RepID=UPI001F40907F|nr:hypothetical protein [Portibacter marinus]